MLLTSPSDTATFARGQSSSSCMHPACSSSHLRKGRYHETMPQVCLLMASPTDQARPCHQRHASCR